MTCAREIEIETVGFLLFDKTIKYTRENQRRLSVDHMLNFTNSTFAVQVLILFYQIHLKPIIMFHTFKEFPLKPHIATMYKLW